MRESVDSTDDKENWVQKMIPSPHERSVSEADNYTMVTSIGSSSGKSFSSPAFGSGNSLLANGDQTTEECNDNTSRSGLQKPTTKIVSGRDDFDFSSQALLLRRDIDRQINLEEMANVKYLCAGSNSHIFSATWQNQSVIVKVINQSSYSAD